VRGARLVAEHRDRPLTGGALDELPHELVTDHAVTDDDELLHREPSVASSCFAAVSRAQATPACERNNAHETARKNHERVIAAMSELARVPDVLAWLMDPARRTESRYRELVPLSKPGPGEQYAFEVDLDACTGCKSCVSACHTMNGLD